MCLIDRKVYGKYLRSSKNTFYDLKSVMQRYRNCDAINGSSDLSVLHLEYASSVRDLSRYERKNTIKNYSKIYRVPWRATVTPNVSRLWHGVDSASTGAVNQPRYTHFVVSATGVAYWLARYKSRNRSVKHTRACFSMPKLSTGTIKVSFTTKPRVLP